MKKKYLVPMAILLFMAMLFGLVPSPGVTLAAGNSLLQGSNLGCWGVNGDGTINDPFMNNATQRSKASAVIGIMRFPCRTFTDAQIISIVDTIKGAGIEPLVILPAKDQTRAVQIATALKSKATYFEFGNENNYFDGWSGATYASHWSSDVPKIRAAYPGIKIGGPVGSHFDSSGSTYLRDFLNAIKSDASLRPDFISMHVYNEHGEDTSDQAVLDNITNQWGPGIDKIKSDIQSILGVSLPVAITEWNWDAAPEKTNDSRDNNSTFMTNYTFKALDTFNARGVWMACQYDFGAGAGGGHLDMVTSNGTAKPQYTAFVNWKNQNGGTPTPTPNPTPTPTPTPPPGGTTTRFEGEDSTGKSEVKTWPSGYSGTGIGVRWSNGAMTWSKNFTGGTYTFTVRCNDYSGTQTFTVQVDGVTVGGPYTMNAGDKSWKTFTGSFGNVSAGTHTIGVNFTSDSATSDLYCDYIEVTGP